MSGEHTQAGCPHSKAKTCNEEPTFTMRASDLFAPTAIRVWARLAKTFQLPAARVREAEECAIKMERWRKGLDSGSTTQGDTL